MAWSAGSADLAAEVAARMVRAYGELRQVEQLLASLAAAASAQDSCSEAAGAVLERPAFTDALDRVRAAAPVGAKSFLDSI